MTDTSEVLIMERAALLSLWRDLFERPAPKGLSQNMLRRFLAFEIQSRAQGGLKKSTRAKLSMTKTNKHSSLRLKPGGRLIREWNGATHIVEVTETGLQWRGQNWRSLSVIAREITGAHWSGPRFFGLSK